ncbi:MAG: long-chain fatty acid--CoA ligase [Gammaproteobacteria bacterium]|nr:long-chain fatty acid--CoA ligase [Gammaproteobacteria bacterium]|tara:strand:+ start:12076 stop:13809 length:1734 start_codon:yes stop_codon:yes gene_type:complete
MLSDAEILQDLEQLKNIVAAHKAPNAPLSVGSAIIDNQELPVFSKAPANLYELYRIGLTDADQDFLVYEAERYSFGEAFTAASKLSRQLRERYGIDIGDRVAICARNSPEWCLAYMAITMIGAIVVPMNSWWTGSELEYGLKDSGAKLIFADTPRFDAIEPSLSKLGIEVVLIRPTTADSDFQEIHSLISGCKPLEKSDLEALSITPEHDTSIMYTSGSTGHPKGVLSTHRGIISALFTWKFVKEINEILRPELREENPPYQAALLANVPLFHVTGSHAQFLASFLYQRKFVMMYKWNAEAALELIENERISVLHGVPTMTWEVMQSPKFATSDLSSLRSVQSGGAPRPPEHLAMMIEKFPDYALPGLGYGLTETNALGAIISGKFYQSKPNSTGRPTPPLTQVRIVDERGQTLSSNEIGEICIKGPSVMKGYWNKPKATAEVLKDGWFHTGDLGLLDDLGFLIILDRVKDIVIRGGENIGCAEVEYSIHEHFAVSEVSVYGIPDPRLGEVPCATIMLREGQTTTADELTDFLRDRIAAFKIPSKFYFQREQLPRIASGKIAKKILRQQTIDRLADA